MSQGSYVFSKVTGVSMTAVSNVIVSQMGFQKISLACDFPVDLAIWWEFPQRSRDVHVFLPELREKHESFGPRFEVPVFLEFSRFLRHSSERSNLLR